MKRIGKTIHTRRTRGWGLAVLAISVALVMGCSPSSAPDPPITEAPSGEIRVVYEQPAAPPVVDANGAPVTDPSADPDASLDEPFYTPRDVQGLMDELDAARARVAQLEQMNATLVNNMMNRTTQENASLRSELQRMYTMLSGKGGTPPGAGGMAIETEPQSGFNTQGLSAVKGDTTAQIPPTAPAPALEAVAVPSAASVPFTVIKEWTVTPEEAMAKGVPNASKTMFCSVPTETDNDTLLAFARELRARYEEYPNLSIEVFDNADAARAYAEQDAPPGDHRILAVARRTEMNLDVIRLNRNGQQKEFPPR